MASRKFRFVSPGVFLKEIDNSQLPGQAPGIGPVIIGRTRKGPAMKPYKVKSLEEFDRVFGKPMPGNEGSDPWRQGTDLLAESYLPYAAKAYLSAGIESPVTVVRLAGVPGEDSVADSAGEPGWKAESAWGLFVFASGSHTIMTTTSPKLELAGVFYGSTDHFGIKLKGLSLSGSTVHTAEAGTPVLFSSTSNRLNLVLSGSSSRTREVQFLAGEIRKDFNTNPVATNSRIMTPASATLADEYWLGETFEESIRKFESSISASDKRAAVILKLDDEMAVFRSAKHSLNAARTGWIIGNDTAMNNSTFSVASQQKLFRLIAIQEGAEANSNLITAIEDIKIPRDGEQGDRLYGTFSIVVKRITSTSLEEIERFDNCNLNPSSDNYIAKMIGDQYFEWAATEKRNKLYGTHPNISEFVRVDMDRVFDAGQGPSNKETVPFGFLGPIVPKTLSDASVDSVVNLSNSTAGHWVASNIALSGVLGVTASWAEFPLVITGSSDSGYYMGATPYKRAYTSGMPSTVTEEVNPGYSDHTRRLADLDAAVLTTDQDDGTATSAKTEHAFSFSMDEVVLVPSPVNSVATASITRASEVSVARYEAGSKLQVAATKTSGILVFGTKPVTNDAFEVRVPSTMGTGKVTIVFKINGAMPVAAPNVIAIRITGNATTADDVAFLIEMAFAGTNPGTAVTLPSGGTTAATDIVYASAGLGMIGTGISGATATRHASKVAFTATTPGTGGNDINLKDSVQDFIETTFGAGSGVAVNLAGGLGPATPSFSSVLAAASGSASALRPLTEIVKGFHIPLAGGFDGTDITEANPFNNNTLNGKTTANSYAYASVDRAIELVKDAEAIEHNLALMPGITNTSLTTKLVRACEARGDSMAIIDLPSVYVPPSENACTSFDKRIQTTPEAASAALVKRQLNSSYGAAYYPWCKIRDDQNSRDVWVPPSVVALGVMAYTEKRDEVWFAPAGFNRGGLNQGNAGVPVLQVSEQLLSRDRDTLYEANINPIASFVSEGLVVFGQKTLQSTQSALDRINVRRLLIFIKKVVSRISNNLLFEQNVNETWNRFINAVVPELQSIKTRFGLSDFKVVLDDTTTTPDLVDRNIMYAKIFLKPARSIEFIAVDFVITNTGASFDD